ncbi:hypothetical protein ACH4S8_04440 [Streptomyces sp. NPDC021080]|uniref:hypothetical protein n=1 Tax=Streptomyces sp. NPDC021080 TaxID=3365110 RepID=UPI0037A80994
MKRPEPGARLVFLGLPGAGAGALASTGLRAARRAVWLRPDGPRARQAVAGRVRAVDSAEQWRLIRRRLRPPRPEPRAPRPTPYRDLVLTVLPDRAVAEPGPGGRQITSAAQAGAGGLVVATALGGHTWWEHRLLVHQVQAAVEASSGRSMVLAVTGCGRLTDPEAVREAFGPWAVYLGTGQSTGRLRGITVPVGPPGRGSLNAAVPLLWHLNRTETDLTRGQRRRTRAVLERAAAPGRRSSSWPWERVRPVLAAVPTAPDRDVRVTVLGAPGSGRTAVLAAIHRVLTPEAPGLWMHLPDPQELRDLIALRRAQEGEAVAASAARRHWTFHLADGTDTVLNVDWLEADTAERVDTTGRGNGASEPGGAAPLPALAGRVRDGACAVFAIDAEHLVVPLDPGRAAAVGEATGAHRADTVIRAAATFHRDRGTPPPLVVMLLTGAERLLQDGRLLRTREGLVADLRLLLPSAFSPDVLAALCPVSTTGGEGGGPAGAQAPAWLLLLHRLRTEADRLRRLAAAERAEAQRLRQQAEDRRASTAKWNPRRLLSYRDDRRADRGKNRAQNAGAAAAANREVETILHRDLRDTTVLLGGEPYTG